jgi:RimJ/RimL family protein N-acetyltransferase
MSRSPGWSSNATERALTVSGALYLSAMPQIPLPDPPLRDEAVALRPWRESDVPWLAAACQDPEIPRWTAIPSPYSEREARAYVTQSELERLAGREIGLAVTDARSGELLASCGLARFEWDERKAEIGYWVAAPARGRSVGTRATTLVSRWGIECLRLERVELLANPGNEPSQRLALRAGFIREGLLRAYRPRKGEREDLVMFSLLAGDLRQA